MSDFALPLSEYPRPQLRRESYICLNGKWEYAISKSPVKPTKFDGFILVPYSPEAPLSGVNKTVFADDFLHYKRTFTLQQIDFDSKIILNVGACDQVCEVYVNSKRAGGHKGGYNAFSLDITDFVTQGENELYFLVTDDAASPIYGRGKQRYNNGGIWYAPTSGLWQTVWLEVVPKSYIESLKLTPDAISKTLYISLKSAFLGEIITKITDGGKTLSEVVINKNNNEFEFEVHLPQCELWSPETPKLYDIEITCGKDKVKSYFGMRSYGVVEIEGRKYFALNGKPCFHNGLLDQGYFEGGLYTPKSYQAMYDELLAVKNAGFNMLRKHIKVEPMMWYYYCDVLGILVWQDMINGGGQYSSLRITLAPFINLHIDDHNYKKMKRSEQSREQYFVEATEMMAQLYNCVSVCLWTPFNEAWGQFDAIDVWHKLKAIDSTRPFDHASGWQDKGGGDLYSRHIYFRKVRMKNDGKRVLALTEFGGYSHNFEGHVFTDKKFGYKTFHTQQTLIQAYKNLYFNEIIPLIKKQGLCATVYTQLTDVEDEINGLFTFDRYLKIPLETLKEINEKVYKAFNNLFEN